MTTGNAKHYDAIVIGGGHNGLVAAALMGQIGKRTLLIEASAELGGMAVHAPAIGRLSETVVRALALDRHGLRFRTRSLATEILREGTSPLPLQPDDPAATRQAIHALSPADAEAWPHFQQRMARLAAGLAPFLERTPPRLRLDDWGERWELARLGFAVRRMGRADMRDLLRILPLNVADLAEEVFESDVLRGLLSFDAVLGNRMGARSPNTVFPLLMRHAGGAGCRPGTQAVAEGGTAALIDALRKAAASHGVEIRTDAPVARILVEDGRATGVELTDGGTIRAGTILSSAHAGTTLIDLVGPRHLDTDFTRAVRHARGAGVTAHLILNLSAPPAGGDPDTLATTRRVHAPSIQAVERAFDRAKYGELPEDPPFEVTVVNEGEGHARAHALIQYVPGDLKDGDWKTERDAFTKRLVARIEDLCPDLAGRVEGAHLATPADIAARHRAPGGHWHHLETGLDQAFMLRPVPGWAQYRTPIEGLFLCGASTHPGGWISGQPGLNGARAALAAEKASGKVKGEAA
ncbi:NAD(P)/FAD-dependent oxidoreductase [Marivibrio halodurans]|uniref:Pyridine nucleotide-disulfide oxidoreductase domain-containing protein 2 n=1 Tax=Marivibrio halodurans TaxID=2039722 RepID=A0A8J7RZ27_9PROT|nr:NAD(P)/FAD-dependent oxidoreductase [Marivibrio halodurans]MBP5855718.1 NAD(P)/FAD-dependent oxidoreductase [Marivibrio halodurans]